MKLAAWFSNSTICRRATAFNVRVVIRFFNIIVQTIDAFKAFTPAFIISGGTGGPIDSTLFYTLYLYQEAFGYLRMGYAAALAWLLVVAIASATALAFWSSRRWVHYEA